MRKAVVRILAILAFVGPLAFFVLILSPRIASAVAMRLDGTVVAEGRVGGCLPHRDGHRRQAEVVCRFAYEHAGRRYLATGTGWSSDSPFLTSAGLEQAVIRQSATPMRRVAVDPLAPWAAELLDERWAVMPPLWIWLLAVFVAMIAVLFITEPSGVPYRRADLALDPATGNLVPINYHRRDRIRMRLAAQGCAALIAGAICLFGLSNQPANTAMKAGMSDQQPIAARLVNCAHHYQRAGRTGNDRIDCDFLYNVGGRTYRGEAESLRFGLFPTKARMDALVERLNARPSTTAYVDRRYPTYALAFISQDTFVPFTWGLFELQLVILTTVMAGFATLVVVRWRTTA